MTNPDIAWQPSLLDGGAVGFDDTFGRMQRRVLTDGAWVDHRPGWCHGSDELFARLLAETPWRGRTVHMYDRAVAEPRLTHCWVLDDGPPPPHDLREMAEALSDRYRVRFTQVGVNLYRDGADSVAWHGDRVARDLPEAVVALVSLGASRRRSAAAGTGGPRRARPARRSRWAARGPPGRRARRRCPRRRGRGWRRSG